MGLLTWFIWYYTKQVNINDEYKTRFFEDSPESKYVLEKMKRDGISNDSRIEFASMEDRLIMLMKQMYPNIEVAKAQSQQIKDRFQAYDFEYHEDILKWKSKLFSFTTTGSGSIW